MFNSLTRTWRFPTGRRQSPNRRWLSVASLEDRTVPAGNVAAALVSGTLTLTGDGLGNSIQLLPGSQPNEIVVVGDGTTVNGASQQTFTGVGGISADMGAGNDSLVADGLNLSADSFDPMRIVLDGNAGNDLVELTNVTIQAPNVAVQIYGEQVTATSGSGTSGNDTIRLSGTRILTGVDGPFGNVSVQIFGETNQGGVVAGGNDRITIENSIFSASGAFVNSATVEIDGETNTSDSGQTSTIGGGNDLITVSNTTIAAAGTPGLLGNSASLTIVGDSNTVTGYPGGGTATIGGGSDRIGVENTSVSATGESFGNSSSLIVIGDQNNVTGYLTSSPNTATVGGGNDRITVSGAAVSAVGASLNQTLVQVSGEDIHVSGPAGTASTVGGGSDSITVQDLAATANGPAGSSQNFAFVVVQSDYAVLGGAATSVIGAGNDAVSLDNVQVHGNAFNGASQVIVETGAGDDRVSIAGSSAQYFTVHLGDGDDSLTFDSNVIGAEASLDGGPGFDQIEAHGNTGTLVWFDFEAADVTP